MIPVSAPEELITKEVTAVVNLSNIEPPLPEEAIGIPVSPATPFNVLTLVLDGSHVMITAFDPAGTGIVLAPLANTISNNVGTAAALVNGEVSISERPYPAPCTYPLTLAVEVIGIEIINLLLLLLLLHCNCSQLVP